MFYLLLLLEDEALERNLLRDWHRVAFSTDVKNSAVKNRILAGKDCRSCQIQDVRRSA